MNCGLEKETEVEKKKENAKKKKKENFEINVRLVEYGIKESENYKINP